MMRAVINDTMEMAMGQVKNDAPNGGLTFVVLVGCLTAKPAKPEWWGTALGLEYRLVSAAISFWHVSA